jgi:DNA-binding GntR family transcriptional regulator
MLHQSEAGSAPAAVAEEDAARVGERDIAERIVAAVMEHRLPAGAKLSEVALCEAFDTTRARVRRALLVLSERGIVELHSNRGAFVASPSPEDARNVFQARCVVEPPIMRSAVQRLTDAQIAMLEQYVANEHAAEHLGNRREMIRLSGLFHVKLASFAGNPVLQRIVEDLVARSSLIIGLFGDSRQESCSHSEHERLLDAIRRRDAKAAPGMMTEHLNAIERSLNLTVAVEKSIDLKNILKG